MQLHACIGNWMLWVTPSNFVKSAFNLSWALFRISNFFRKYTGSNQSALKVPVMMLQVYVSVFMEFLSRKRAAVSSGYLSRNHCKDWNLNVDHNHISILSTGTWPRFIKIRMNTPFPMESWAESCLLFGSICDHVLIAERHPAEPTNPICLQSNSRT
jgi:hypothetical protein